MYVNLFSGVALMTKILSKNKPIWNILNYSGFHVYLSCNSEELGVFGDSNEQFGTHDKLSPTSTVYVKCMKHDPIDLIYNFTLSKALLIHIYIVSI